MKTFKSKIDLWLGLTLGCSVIVSVWGAWDLFMNQASVGNYFTACFLLLLGAGLPIWLLIGTKYSVAGSVLKVSSGPFRWQIELSAIDNVKSSRSILSGPALSLDRLEIEFESGKRILVSPKDKSSFLAAIGHKI
ncbi:PH domain-containing protein [Vibrio vulnificus]|uniref:PH domain-containing protein n=1 Tax=Vibrio vulnificus TaxID=672 RepID=UPI003ED94E0A